MNDLAEFRADTKAWLHENLPESLIAGGEEYSGGSRETVQNPDTLRWFESCYEQGWTVPTWPREFGGAALESVQAKVLQQEMAMARAPIPLSGMGVTMIGPTLLEHGTDDQRARHLSNIANGKVRWCQGYSEPSSGSDLASLKTRAVRDGDDYVVNGSKIWTTSAHWADMIFCLVRTDTDVKKQEGISFLLINMHDPGIEVRPLITLDGGHEVNQVFFTDVRVPATNLVGEENKGWTYAKFLLKHERASVAAIGAQKRQLQRLKEIARGEQSSGGKLIEEPTFRDKISKAEIDLMALEYTELRAVSAANLGETPGTEVNLLKIRGSEMQQKISELMLEAIGYYANPFLPESAEPGWNETPVGPEYAAHLAPDYFNWRKSSIYSGSNEVQKNIISKMVLGL